MKELRYNIINVGTSVNELNTVKDDITAILVYADADLLKKQQSIIFLRDRAVEDDTPFFVIGDVNELAALRDLIPKQLLKKEFQRPIDVKEVVSEIDEYVKT